MGKRVKIFVIGPRGFPGVQGGIERFSESFYPLLVEQGYEVTTFAIKKYCTHKEWKGVKFAYVPAPSSKTLEKFFYNFYTAIYCIFKRPDIIHIHSIASGFFIFLLKIFNLKILARYNSRDYLHAKWSRLGKFVLQFSEKQFLSADYIIANNKSYLTFLQSLGRNKNISFIPNGIDLPDVKKYSSSLTLNVAGISVGEPYLLYVGRITEEKNIHTLIETFLKLGQNNLKLVIAGDAAHQDNYFQTIKSKHSNSNIIFPGKVERETLNVLYANCQLFVLPSLHEGMPNVLLEAMSFNCKLLVSKIPAHTQFEFDKDDYFEPLDSEELSQKITNKLSSSRQEDYSEKLSDYSWDKIVASIHAIHLEILNPVKNA